MRCQAFPGTAIAGAGPGANRFTGTCRTFP
jgi:hypothetical protein